MWSSRLLSVIAVSALALSAGASRSAADVVTGERTQLVLIAVDRVSSTAPPEQTEQAWRQASASLQGDRDLDICLERARVRRGAGSVSATLVFDRAREPRVSLAARGAIPASARRCIQTAAAAVWLRAAPAGRVTLRARFEIVTLALRDRHRPGDRPEMPF